MEKTWKPATAGILGIIAGIVGVIFGIVLAALGTTGGGILAIIGLPALEGVIAGRSSNTANIGDSGYTRQHSGTRQETLGTCISRIYLLGFLRLVLGHTSDHLRHPGEARIYVKYQTRQVV
jgi:hypothetical protein